MTCATCGGSGFVTVYDTVDYGSTTASMPSEEPCHDCWLVDKCPQCGAMLATTVTPPEEDTNLVWYRDSCIMCGWQSEEY